MKCPLCDIDLVMTERQGIEIDYCPKCRGVWLDRGELDKIIERSTAELNLWPLRKTEDHDLYRRDDDRRKDHYRKKSFLWELFD